MYDSILRYVYILAKSRVTSVIIIVAILLILLKTYTNPFRYNKINELTANLILQQNEKRNQIDVQSLLPMSNNLSISFDRMGQKELQHVDSNYLALCLIIKNDFDDINEWIEYHYRKGVSKFYIIDHNSRYPLNDYITSYIRQKIVSYYYLNRSSKVQPNPQLFTYQTCIDRFSSFHQFMGFIDNDEFIVTVNESLSIPNVLRNYEKFGGLALNWLIYGHSNYIERPDGGVRNYYTCQRNHHVKTIVNTKALPKVRGDPHNFIYSTPLFTVDTNKNRVDGPWNHPKDTLYDVMYINHYLYKSKADFDKKSLRGSGDGTRKSKDFWDSGNFSKICKPLVYPKIMNITMIEDK